MVGIVTKRQRGNSGSFKSVYASAATNQMNEISPGPRGSPQIHVNFELIELLVTLLSFSL